MNTVDPLIPCIVSGGSGTRLWPVSRESMPKPFMRLADDQSLLQKTFLRIAGLPDVARLLTVTNRDLLFRTLDDYRAVNRSGLAQDLLLEPMGRNTAPAIAAAALHVQEHFGDQAQLLILPADHLIRDEQAFAAAVAEARGLAAQGYLVTFGITPERAETGFGYIEQGAPLGNGFRVARFVEKPDQATAQSYLDSGKYLWNAGMFCFQAATVLQELERHAPEVLIAARAALADGSSLENGQCRQRELAAGAFAEAPDISVDYALMERSDKVAVVPCSIGWSDIGSWQALRELSAADENGNQVRGESVLHDVSNCYIDSPKRLVGAVGVHDLIIVDTPDALLVADAARSQDVKFVAQELKRRGHDAFRLHRTVSRPWGTYTVLEEGRRFKIKRIVVRPKASLSLQMHHHRSEHWIVVSGMALVENGEREFLLNTNESTFIPAGHSHRLSNPGIIETRLVTLTGLGGECLARRMRLPPGRVEVINHGNLEIATVPLPSLDTLRLLYFGFIYRGKGIEDLLEALADLFASAPEMRQRVRLTLAGGTAAEMAFGAGGNYLDQLKAQIAELGLADAIDWNLNLAAADIPRTIQAHHVMVLPYRESKKLGLLGQQRGTSGALSWAAACGRGAITSDARAFAEEVASGNGAIYPQGDVAALSEQLLNLAREPRLAQAWAERAGAIGHARTWPRTALRFQALFNDMVGTVHGT